METAASFEVRNAPSSYPTTGDTKVDPQILAALSRCAHRMMSERHARLKSSFSEVLDLPRLWPIMSTARRRSG
jgi:hypothetical protein